MTAPGRPATPRVRLGVLPPPARDRTHAAITPADQHGLNVSVYGGKNVPAGGIGFTLPPHATVAFAPMKGATPRNCSSAVSPTVIGPPLTVSLYGACLVSSDSRSPACDCRPGAQFCACHPGAHAPFLPDARPAGVS